MSEAEMYTAPCPKCPTLVTFERVAGVLRIECGQCGAVIWHAEPAGGKHAFAPLPIGARRVLSTPAPKAVAAKVAVVNDNNIGPSIKLTEDEERRARDLLNW